MNSIVGLRQIFVYLALLAGVAYLLSLTDVTSLEFLGRLFEAVKPELIFLAILAQTAAILVSTWGWRLSQSSLGIQTGVWTDSLTQMGLLSIGKYLPGKVFGMLARGLASRCGGSSVQAIVRSTLLEQIALIHSGSIFGAGCYWIATGNRMAATVFVCTVVPVIFPTNVSRAFALLLAVPLNWQWLNSLRETNKQLQRFLTREVYLPVVMVFMLVWAITALGLHLCVSAIGGEGVSYYDAGYAVAVSYLAGFAVFIVPGGIGVREASIVALISGTVGLQMAVSVATLHRLVSLIVDALFGAFALSKYQELKKQYKSHS